MSYHRSTSTCTYDHSKFGRVRRAPMINPAPPKHEKSKAFESQSTHSSAWSSEQK